VAKIGRSICFLAAMFSISVDHAAVADFSFIHGGHSYLVIEQGRTWQAAAADAVARQVAGAPGYLTIIETAAENSAIFSELGRINPRTYGNTRAPDGGNGVYAWIGANDLATEGDWIWDGDNDGVGELFYRGLGNAGGGPIGGRYHNWGTFNGGPWEPDNGAGGLQDAGVIALVDYPRGLAGQWNDVRADNSLYYVVEFNAVPEPSVAALFIVGILLGRVRRRAQ